MTAKPAQSTFIKKDVAHFSSDAQLLAELGERLVASPHVALAELAKNAFDADASTANIWLSEGEEVELNIEDDGHGMTEQEFLDYWMIIATTSKLQREVSRRHKRVLSGSKGVGRFAVRLLGGALHLETTAKDPKTKEYRRLIADFNWSKFGGGAPMNAIGIPYRIERSTAEDEGTLLRIGVLSSNWTDKTLQEVSGPLLNIIEPPLFQWLARRTRPRGDPGFKVLFAEPGDEGQGSIVTAGKEIIDRCVASAHITVSARGVKYEYEYTGLEPRTFTHRLDENLVGDLEAEVRYFPKRPGVFSGMATLDGRMARRWLVEHSGVKVYDRGFRVPPYGEEEDDWLALSMSKAERTREWRSFITEGLFPASERNKAETEDPLLKVPHNRQLYGVVAVSSFRPVDGDVTRKLQPAMDRQGFVENDGYRQMQAIVRGGVEILAVLDVEETRERLRREAKKRASETRKKIAAAIARVKSDKSIPTDSRREIVRNYEAVSAQVTRLEEAQDEASRAVETMALLGVLSGFMTHEATLLLRSSERMLLWLRKVPKSSRDAEYDEIVKATQDALAQLRSHLDYAETFVRGALGPTGKPFKVRPQVDLVCNQLTKFASDRGIEFQNEVPDSLMSPPVSISVYSGILLNLLTNAIKAVLARGAARDTRFIRFDADSEADWHVLRVSDTGVGVPEELRDKIFEPLFTTTTDSPLGAGMGLGLHIVRRLLRELRGSIALREAVDGFATTFEVRLRNA